MFPRFSRFPYTLHVSHDELDVLQTGLAHRMEDAEPGKYRKNPYIKLYGKINDQVELFPPEDQTYFTLRLRRGDVPILQEVVSLVITQADKIADQEIAQAAHDPSIEAAGLTVAEPEEKQLVKQARISQLVLHATVIRQRLDAE